MRKILKEIKRFLLIEKNYYKSRLQELKGMTLKEKLEDLKLQHRISKIIETEEQREKRRFYLSLISLIISLVSLIFAIKLL